MLPVLVLFYILQWYLNFLDFKSLKSAVVTYFSCYALLCGFAFYGLTVSTGVRFVFVGFGGFSFF